MLRIQCKQPGFRRCGMAHPADATYPDNRFTAAQKAQLKAEPMLTVTELSSEDAGADGKKAKGK